MFIFLLKDYFKVGPWFKNWETKPVHSAQCRHVVACTHQIRRNRRWELLLKTIWDWESQPYQVSNMNHTLSKFPIKLHLRVCQVCCCAGARIILLCFSRFVVHQIVFQCVCFFGLSCAKSCSNACFFSRFFVRQIVLYGLNYVESPCSCYSCSENVKLQPKTGGCVLFSSSDSSELRPGSGRS